MPNATITGWGKCMPPAVLSNHDLEQLTDTSDEWISIRTGIKERRISHVEVSEMAEVAGRRALAAAGKKPDDLDLIILATCTADSLIPSSAAVLQDRLGASRAAAFDLNAACSGFVYGLVVAAGMIATGGYRSVLVAGAEKLHRHLDFTDRSTAVLFGDGAGAVVVEATDDEVGLVASELGMDGSVREILAVPRDGSAGDVGAARPEESGIKMAGPEVFRRAVVGMGDAVVRALDRAGVELDDIDLFIPHQANVRIIDAVAKRLGLPPSKVFINIASYGNTSSATIPVALTEAIEEGRVQPGSLIAFAAFGAGLSWAAALVRWGERIVPLSVSDAALPPSRLEALDLLQPNLDFYGRPELGRTP